MALLITDIEIRRKVDVLDIDLDTGELSETVCHILCIPGLFLCVDVPYHVIGQAVDAITGTLRHLREALRFGLIFESVAGKVDACFVC